MSSFFPLSDFSTPSPFLGLGVPGLVGASNSSSAPTASVLPDGSPDLVPALGSPSPFAACSVDISSGSAGASLPVDPNAVSSSPSVAPTSGAQYDSSFLFGASGAPQAVGPLDPSYSPSRSSAPARPGLSPLKSRSTPSPSPRHNPSPKRPFKPAASSKSSASSPKGVVSVKQVPGSSVFLRDLPLELLTMNALRVLLIGHNVSGYSANRTRSAWSSLLRSHVCRSECEALTYEVEHLVTLSTGQEYPSQDDVQAAVFDLIEKHLKTDEKFPPCISRTIKDTVVSKWLDYFSNQSMKMTVCSVCSERLLESQTDVHSLDSDTLRWLSNPSLPPGLHPKGYDFELLERAILDPQGIVQSAEGRHDFVVCKSCSGYLSKNKLPPLSLANDNYLGFDCVPDNIRNLFNIATPVELSLVSRYRVRCTVHKYSQKTKNTPSPDAAGTSSFMPSQSYMLGNTITFANECSSLLSVLPPPAEVLGETICYVHWFRLSESRRDPKDDSFDNHSGYKDVVLSRSNLDAVLPNDDPAVPNGVFISHLPSAARETEPSGYTNTADDIPEGPEIPTSSNGVISESIEGLTIRENKALAIKHWKTGGGAFTVPHGTNPINEYDNPKLFPCMFPHLFPWGIGGFEDANRRVKVTMEAHVKHLLNLSDVRPQTDRNFSFVAMNILQRRKTSKASRFSVKATHYDRAAELLCSAEASACDSIVSRSKANRGYVAPETKAEKELFELMDKVNIMASNVPGSSASKVKMRNEIRALNHWLGTPSLFITLNPADLHSPIFCHFAGAKVDLDSCYPELPSGFERLSLLAKNPAAAARFFNSIMRAFIDVVLDMDSPDGGLFGRISGYYGTIEAQGRGSLHCHMLVWISGSLGPDALRAKLDEDSTFRESLFNWLNDTIKTEVPGQPYDENVSMDNAEFDKRPDGERHPCTCRCPRPKESGVPDPEFDSEFQKQLYRLVLDCNWHFHKDTCWKYMRPGDKKDHEHCRMRKDGTKRAEPGLEPQTGAILHRQTHPRINAYHDILIMLLKSNIDISFIGSGPATKALIYYITDYITKSGLPTHVAFSALQVVIQKVKTATQDAEHSQNPEAVLNASKQGRQLLTKACNALVGQQELSGQQVAMHLLRLADGEGDHYTSHEFRALHWAAFRGWLRNELQVDSPATSLNAEPSADERDKAPPDLFHEDIDEDEVFIDLSKDGNLSLAHSQLKDYRFRGNSLAKVGLYWFVALTERITFKSEQTRKSSKDPSAPSSNAGAKPMPRVLFLRDHPHGKTHLLRLRRTPLVPVIIGPSLASKSSDYERYCCDMLMLFKPWRTLADLRNPGDTWSKAFEAMEFDEPSRIKIANMNHLHECKDAKDAYNDLRRKGVQKHNLIDDRMLSAHPAVRDAFEPPSIDEDSEVLNVIREFTPHLLEPSRRQNDHRLTRDERRVLSANEAVGVATHVGLNEIDDDAEVDILADDAAPLGSAHGVDLEAMKRQMVAYKEKLNAEVGTEDDTMLDPEDDDPEDSRLATIDDFVSDPQSTLIHDVNPAFSEDAESLVNEVAAKNKLNEQQERALKIIAYHKISGIDNQLMMIVAGPGGTGKSRVIAALTELYEKLNIAKSLKKTAPTGIAAYAINGTTVHSLLGLVGSGKTFGPKALEKAQNRLAGVTDIFVDEFSMVGADFFSLMSTRLGQVRGNDKPFGGLNMTFFGDPRQLPPVGDSPLWRPIPLAHAETDVQDRTAKLAGSPRGQRITHGQGLWSQIEEVVLLTENHRAKLDQDYVDIIERIARGRGTESDRQCFLSREITTAHFDRKDWVDAPLVTADKVMRDRWNLEAARSFASRTRRELCTYVASDQMNARLVKGQFRDVLLNYPSSTKTRDRIGQLPLVCGMRVMLLHNILTSVGVVNGAEGTIERIIYDETLSGDRVASVVFVKIEGAVVNIPGLEPGVVPVFPDTVTMKLPLKNQQTISVSRTQLPLLPAYAFTDYKSQARTLERVVLDLASAGSLESAYVMVSRAVGLKNVLLLRPFPLTKIERQQSPGVFAEMARLKTLNDISKARFARNEETRKARSAALRSQLHASTSGPNPNALRPKFGDPNTVLQSQ